jgi:hypothetical protein
VVGVCRKGGEGRLCVGREVRGGWCVGEGVAAERRKLQNEGLRDLHCSPNITCWIKSRTDGRAL